VPAVRGLRRSAHIPQGRVRAEEPTLSARTLCLAIRGTCPISLSGLPGRPAAWSSSRIELKPVVMSHRVRRSAWVCPRTTEFEHVDRLLGSTCEPRAAGMSGADCAQSLLVATPQRPLRSWAVAAARSDGNCVVVPISHVDLATVSAQRSGFAEFTHI
jgi:hypothetical protein